MGTVAIEKVRAGAVSRTEQVDVEEWGATVTIRALTRAEFTDIWRKIGNQDSGYDADLETVLVCRVDPDLGDEARGLLEAQPAGIVGRLARAAVRLSGVSPGSFRGGPEPDDDRRLAGVRA